MESSMVNHGLYMALQMMDDAIKGHDSFRALLDALRQCLLSI